MPPWSSKRSDYRKEPSPYQPASTALQQAPAVHRINYGNAEGANDALTIIALQAGTAVLAREYWIEGDKVAWVSVSGDQQNLPLNAIDLSETVKVNHERNVEFALHTRHVLEQ